jgi:hypothetical protein
MREGGESSSAQGRVLALPLGSELDVSKCLGQPGFHVMISESGVREGPNCTFHRLCHSLNKS